MAKRINRAIELLEQNQTIYYDGGHTGHVLTYEQGLKDAHIWADYINVGMEHGSFDMAGLDQYIRGLIDGGPTKSGHRTPAVIVETPVEGSSEEIIRFNAWQFRMVLARGVHGILLCQAETPDAVRAFIESCRYPINMTGVGHGLERGTRGTGSQPTSAPVWGVDADTYVDKAEPWPLNPEGELLLGVKIETVRALSNCELSLAVPGLGFAEWGPGDLHMSFGIKRDPDKPMDPRLLEARDRVKAACDANNLAFLEGATLENITEKIDEGVRIIAGHREDTAEVGRSYSKRTMPVG
ncbi:MAG: aldolase/citrate lyase family protein [Dehalococcoidia bacterium]|nr:aldolase/citrate lyase family protein [Dehalococcoidia bacterium]|tara:strand:- start:1753 stop:2640 length:888 start_codon:yes stop_codon:yes gene_type:complete